MKKQVTALIAATMCAAALLLGGCGENASQSNQPQQGSAQQEQQASEPLDLTGDWKQADGTDDAWMAATIKGKTITVNWVSDSGDTESLYWKGTYKAPTDDADSYEWTSKGDTKAMAKSLMASSDSEKEFAYKDGQLTYKASALGTTKTIRMNRE